MRYKKITHLIFPLFCLFISCEMKTNSNKEMGKLLADVDKSEYTMTNAFCPEAKLAFYDSLLATPASFREASAAAYYKAITLLELGDELESISTFEDLLKRTTPSDYQKTEKLLKGLAIAHMRLGERTNCLHNRSA